ncbi:Exocyst complex component 2, partial [Goodea atripinnis]
VSMDAVRELDGKLFEAYIERRADPIAGSLEPGMYAGYFDWRHCQTPTGTRQTPGCFFDLIKARIHIREGNSPTAPTD